jgi:hypothetical protein
MIPSISSIYSTDTPLSDMAGSMLAMSRLSIVRALLVIRGMMRVMKNVA